MSVFDDTFRMVERLQTLELAGTVAEVRGLTLRVADLSLPIGAMVRVPSGRGAIHGEVVGFDDELTIVMPLGDTTGVRRGDRAIGTQAAPLAMVGEGMLGRIVDGLGRPLDGKGPLGDLSARPLRPAPVDPMRRVPIDRPLGTGVRAIDAMLSVGRGQRLGVFSGPGIGKSTVLGMMARQTEADVAVIALIGERGREVRDFVENALGQRGLDRCIVVAATADEPALMRLRAAMLASAAAEHFREQGLDVVLLMDSVTRFCQAARQVGLAAGEPPATRGYPPSVFAALPALLERSGRTADGSITGFYAILVEGDDLTEPISDACRGILDGHIVLDRDLANRGHWPAIDILQSVSRIAVHLTDGPHREARSLVAQLISHWRQVEELVHIGAYAAGSNPEHDLAIEVRHAIAQFLQQRPEEAVTFAQARSGLLQLATQIRHTAQKLQRQAGGGAPAAPR